jgi:flagellar protein FliS
MNAYRTEALLKSYRGAGLAGLIQEADPHRLIQMLLDGGCSRMALARAAIAAHDYERKGRLISEAMTIVSHLRTVLDRSAGGEMAKRLDALYDYILRRLLQASAAGDVSILEETSMLLGQIKSAWDVIAQPANEQSRRLVAEA